MTADTAQPQQSQDKYAPTSWGAPKTEPEFEELEVPSGQLCLVRRPGVQGLLRAGVISSVDSLTAKVAQYVTDGRMTADSVRAMQKDPEAIAGMTQTVDLVVCYVVVKPEIQMPPNDVTRRENGVIYADTIDLADRVFIFNFAVAGVRDLESFRRGTAALVESVAAEQGLGDSALLAAVSGRSAGGVVPEQGSARVREQRRGGAGDRGKRRTEPVAGEPRTPAGAGADA